MEKIITNNISLWGEVLDIVKDKIPTPTFETCLKNTKIDRINTNQIEIVVASELIKELLNKKEYYKLIQEATEQVFQRKMKIVLKVNNLLADFPITKKAEEHKTHRRINLNPKYTFENFVVGPSNSLAHAASIAVAENPASNYNPLFIYGGVGLGKTHLMHAIGHKVIKKFENLKVMYVSTETFTNELIMAIQKGTMNEFRNRYRTVDILLVDDIQFLANKERTQEEFFHTFNDLHSSNKQIVISSDRQPKEIPTLEDRLRSRFEWGLIADIQKPDIETREAILLKKAQMEGVVVPNEVIHYIAKRVPSNIRELEGALITLIAISSMEQKDITLALAQRALKGLLPEDNHKNLTPEIIINTISHYFAIKPEDMLSNRRDQNISRARHIAMYFCRELLDESFPSIAQIFGGKDHSTVMYAYSKIKESTDPGIRHHLNNIMDLLKKN